MSYQKDPKSYHRVAILLTAEEYRAVKIKCIDVHTHVTKYVRHLIAEDLERDKEPKKGRRFSE